MVYYELRIGNFKAKITPIKAVLEENYQDVDINGKPLKWIKGSATRGYFVDSDEKKAEKGYKLINGKVMDKLEKTKEVKMYREVDRKEVDNLMKEAYYYVDCDELKEQLQDSNKALKIAYSNGNGFKLYFGYISLFGNALILFLGRGFLSEQINQIEDETIAKKSLEELKGIKIDKAKVEDLIQI